MTPPARDANDDSIKLQQIVEGGTLEELQAALRSGAAVDAPGHLGMTALMQAMDMKDLGKAKLLIQHGADVELTDDFNATALRHAVHADFVDGVRLLLSLGADSGFHPRNPLKKIDYDLPAIDVPMPAELKAVMSEAEWKSSLSSSQEMMREMGQNPTVDPMIADVQSVDVLKLFLEAGDDLNLAPTEVKRAWCGLKTGGELQVARSDYLKFKSPHAGSRNPERMEVPFWREMVRTGVNAYTARTQFNDTNPFKTPGAVWCYERFGSSLTPLPDGRFVQIGGEHEDWYDPDFFIYNDVVVHDGKGDFQIYGYPLDVFPPTDFHTATLCHDCIYIIGRVGYAKQRQPDVTPVYRLVLETWQIETVKSVGEMPRWIHDHKAVYLPDRNVIRIEGGEIEGVRRDGESGPVPNQKRYELDLRQCRWREVQ